MLGVPGVHFKSGAARQEVRTPISSNFRDHIYPMSLSEQGFGMTPKFLDRADLDPADIAHGSGSPISIAMTKDRQMAVLCVMFLSSLSSARRLPSDGNDLAAMVLSSPIYAMDRPKPTIGYRPRISAIP